MGQPIFAIKKSKVKEIVEQLSKLVPIPFDHQWADIRSLDQMMGIIEGIKCNGEYIRMHDLHATFQMIECHKLLPRTNKMLWRVLAICKCYREDLNKISVVQQ